MSINRVVISGNLTRDPELRSTPGGMSVLSLRVAVNDRRKDPSSGEWKDFPNYVDAVMFGTRAENVQRYLSKGSKVMIEGKLRWSEWEKDGQRRSKIEVVVDDLEFAGARPEGGGAPAADRSHGSYNAPAAPSVSAPSDYEEDIPF